MRNAAGLFRMPSSAAVNTVYCNAATREACSESARTVYAIVTR